MTKSLTKSTLDTIERDLPSTDIATMEGIINHSRNDLMSSLNMTNNFFVDQANKTRIDNVAQSMISKERELNRRDATLTTEDNNLHTEDLQLNAEQIRITALVPPLNAVDQGILNNLTARRPVIAARRGAIAAERGRIGTMIGNINPHRTNEYQILSTITDRFDYTRPLQDMRTNTYNIAIDMMIPGAPAATGYNLYNEHGNVLIQPFLTNITLQDGTTQEVQIDHIVFNPPGSANLDVSGIVLLDRAGNPLPPLTQGYEFTVHPGAYITLNLPPAPNINVIHTKPLRVLRRQPGALITQANRANEVDQYNNAGAGNVIGESMTRLSDTNLAKREREAIFRAITQNDGPKFDRLNPEQKEDMYQAIRRFLNPPNGDSPLIPIANFTYNEFRQRVSADNHPSNTPENTANAMAYRNYINNNLETTLIPDFFGRQMNREFIDNIVMNTRLKTEVTRYLSELERQSLESNNVHMGVEGDISARDEMNNRRRRGIFGRRDVNYLRFFAGQDSKVTISNQVVNINTNTDPEDVNNAQPVKYEMNMEVSGKQKMLLDIKIDGQENIPLLGGDPATLIRKVLRHPGIRHGKVRAHIVYNIMKGLIEMCKKKDISLRYRNPANQHNMVIAMEGNNIVLEDQDDRTNYGGSNKRINTVIFDYNLFEKTNTFDSTIAGDNRNLRIGIDRLMEHFNFAMEGLHSQYRDATERRWLGLRKSSTTMDFPTSFRLSPIKKLCNMRRNLDFSFSTSVTANGKTVNIEFKKNKFTLQMEGLKKPISGKDLGKLLRHRVGGIRIFDGMERDICMDIYRSTIEKLRTNTKIARTNYGVRDPLTGRIYILDEEGRFGYISAEDAQQNNPIRKKNAAKIIRKGLVTGGLVAGGFLTGGITSLATPLTLSGAATAGLRGGAIASGVDTGAYLTTHRGREFGVINELPLGMDVCKEHETRELLKNPFLMGRLIKAMSESL